MTLRSLTPTCTEVGECVAIFVQSRSPRMSEVIQGEGFTIKANKFDFFFGRVTSSLENERRSRDNYYRLRQLGIEGQGVE